MSTMQFEIINPSDPYTMTACDLEVAAVAVCLLGSGRYGLRGLGADSQARVPVFLLGGSDEWFMESFGDNYETVATRCLEDRSAALISAFESVTLGQSERSSINDIGGRARQLAQTLRAAASAKAEAAPR